MQERRRRVVIGSALAFYLIALGFLAGIVAERIRFDRQRSAAVARLETAGPRPRGRRVTSPVSGSRLRIFSSMPGPPAPPVAEPATGRQGTSSGRKNSRAGFGSVILENDGVLRFHDRGCPADLRSACRCSWLRP